MQIRLPSIRLLAPAALLLAAAAALAQDQHQPKDGGKDKGGSHAPKMGSDPEPPEAPKAPDKPATPEKTEPEMLVDALGTWPSQEAHQAAIRLRAQPSVAWPL